MELIKLMGNLFQDSISSNNEEYLALRDEKRLSETKDYCLSLWNEFAPFADRSFCREFALHPHQRFWEMYLGVHLLSLDFELVHRKTDKEPDLHLIINNKHVWIEATVPGKGEGADKVPTINEHSSFTPIPVEKIILRFTNNLSEKKDQLRNYMCEGIVKPHDRYLIAINGGRIPLVQFDADPIPAIVKSVYPIGKNQVLIDTNKFEIIKDQYMLRTCIIKKCGSKVSTCFFEDSTNANIPGIIYSETTMINLPTIPKDDFLFIHNNISDAPLDQGWLKSGKECWRNGDTLYFAEKI